MGGAAMSVGQGESGKAKWRASRLSLTVDPNVKKHKLAI
jgi:hypothetical protein